jgi:hypothetical protein
MIRLTPWKTVILLCGECPRKLDGGFGPKGKESFRDATLSGWDRILQHGASLGVRDQISGPRGQVHASVLREGLRQTQQN